MSEPLLLDRQAAFTEALPRARSLALRLARPADRDDLTAAAAAALWDAALRWCPDRGPLWGYARFHVRAALLEEIRRLSTPLSRDDFSLRPALQRAVVQWRERTGCEPTDEDLAALLDVPLVQVRRVRRVRRTAYLAELGEFDLPDTDPAPAPTADVDWRELSLRDLYTVLRYTGLDDAPPASLRTIAAQLGESHETTRTRLRRSLLTA